jgi:ribosomal-protein-alanine N-acetyltransferase
MSSGSRSHKCRRSSQTDLCRRGPDDGQWLAATPFDYGGWVELVSERLVLRPTEMRDLDFYFELRNRPEILALPRRQPSQRSDVERQLQRWLERWQERGFGTWTVFERKTEARLGRVELDPIGAGWNHIAPDEIELGFIVDPTYWNQGIATEAAQLAAADFFNRSELDRLVALTTADNRRSLRALEKLGMRRRGQTQHERDQTTYELFELVPSALAAAQRTGR